MLENSRFSTVKLKKYIRTRSLLPTFTFWSIPSEGIKISKKCFHSFTDVGLHFDLCENESYSTFVAKDEFLRAKICLRNHDFFTN